MNSNIFSRLSQYKHEMAKKSSNVSAFTIVELLIVIVIISILAAITIVSYTGVSQKANIAALQADLTNGAKKLNIYYTLYNTYPTMSAPDATGAICPTGPNTDAQYCLRPSNGNTFTYKLESDPSLGFTLTDTRGSISYAINKATAPYDATVTVTPITAIGSISGTAQMGQTLTAGAITPADATVSYQWQSSDTSNGTYANIAGATSSTYTPDLTTANKYIKVTATGNGNYSGAQTSAATATAVALDSNWLTIGTQTWAKANLNVGTRIAGTSAQTNNSTTEKYCYNDDEANCTTYGGLYQWDEAMNYSTTEGTQGICPAGAHVPSDNDWKILEMQLGMTQAQADATNTWRGTNQGTQLKTGGASGLNVPLAGGRYTTGAFDNLSSVAILWSSSESSTDAWDRALSSGDSTIGNGTDYKIDGFSVRCLKN